MIQDILIALTTILFIVIILLLGSILFDEADWKKKN